MHKKGGNVVKSSKQPTDSILSFQILFLNCFGLLLYLLVVYLKIPSSHTFVWHVIILRCRRKFTKSIVTMYQNDKATNNVKGTWNENIMKKNPPTKFNNARYSIFINAFSCQLNVRFVVNCSKGIHSISTSSG